MKRKITLLLFLISCYTISKATHNRAGQIIYRHISGYTYEVEIWTYTYSLSQADRDSLTIKWGDGTSSVLPRVLKRLLPGYYYENKYIGIHTYPGPGVYQLVMEDPNRNDGVLNIPNSVNTVFALTTTLQINPFVGSNNAPILLTRPIDKGAVGRLFIHNPGAFDPDGDSLSFKMDTCRYDNGKKIPGFMLPPTTNSLHVNEITGDFVWDVPPSVGIYNVAMRIEEWRDGIKIGQIIRDIQIEIVNSQNRPPVIQNLSDICVIAGQKIQFNVTASDPDNDGVYIERYGVPFTLPISPAQFPDSIYGIGSVTGTFVWNTNCFHIAKGPYTVTFKAADDNPEVILTDYKKINIKVLGPPVTITQIDKSNNNVILKWQKNNCENLSGYKIYRRNSFENFTIPTCYAGMPENWGYELIATINDPNTTTYIDPNLIPGFNYCYRIVPLYGEEKIEGIISNKMCIEIAHGYPIIIKTTVDSTSKTSGQITVKWTQPIGFDPNVYTHPPRYALYFSPDLYGLSFNSPIYKNIDDTIFIHKNINTFDNPWCYKVQLEIYNEQTNRYEPTQFSAIAASPFLTIKSFNKTNTLNLNQNTPWENTKYVIYRYKNDINNYVIIDTVTKLPYHDRGLENKKEYCYKIETIGRYTANQLTEEIKNFSQKNCGTPIDTTSPCCPKLEVTSNCSEFFNLLKWTMPADTCYEDLNYYIVKYSPNMTDKPVEIATLPKDSTRYIHEPTESLAGCYIVEAVDEEGHVSKCTEKICIDNCHYYEIPNIFTPNKDNINDILKPLPYKFVEKVNLKFYDRWGNLVFETTDPDINWKGTYFNGNKEVPDGVYYYLGDVYEQRLTGLTPRFVSGFVQIVRNQTNPKP